MNYHKRQHESHHDEVREVFREQNRMIQQSKKCPTKSSTKLTVFVVSMVVDLASNKHQNELISHKTARTIHKWSNFVDANFANELNPIPMWTTMELIVWKMLIHLFEIHRRMKKSNCSYYWGKKFVLRIDCIVKLRGNGQFQLNMGSFGHYNSTE